MRVSRNAANSRNAEVKWPNGKSSLFHKNYEESTFKFNENIGYIFSYLNLSNIYRLTQAGINMNGDVVIQAKLANSRDIVNGTMRKLRTRSN